MSGETIVTVVGNLTADPELRYTQSGLAVANLTIASTPKVFDKQTNQMKDGDALFLRASVWREFAENVSQSLSKGTRVIARGQLKQRSYETQAGEKRTVIELDIEEIGPDLRFAVAQVTRTTGGGAGRSSSPQQPYQQAPAPVQQHDQPWGAPDTTYPSTETPF